MRLYSRSQVALFCAGSAAFAAALVFFLGFARLPAGTAKESSSAKVSVSTEEKSSASGSASTQKRQAEAIRVDTFSSEYSQDETENIDVYERLNEAVVNITTEIVAVNWFLEPVPQEGGSGSGSIIDTRGYVLTNNHVIKDAYKLYVNFADGLRVEAKVVGTDAENDLAVIKFEPPKGKQLTTIPFGDSSRLKVGQKVLAIGNPFALERTLTTGIVSGLGRPIQDGNNIIRDMIQTDASINPGNSGGPLLNSKGEMIGINTMIYSTSGGSVGIGFASPVNTAKRVVPELINFGMVKRGWIDITPIQLFPQLVEYMKQNGYSVPVEAGILVSQAKSAGNADRAGIKAGREAVRYGRSGFYLGGDIIVKVDGQETKSIADLYLALEDNKPGDTVEVEYYRGTKLQVGQVKLSMRTDAMKSSSQ